MSRSRSRLGVVVSPRAAVGEEGRPPHEPPAPVAVLESDPEAPERGAVIRWYATTGAVAREDWYVSADEAQMCLARDFAGRLGPWTPLPAGADPRAVLGAGGGR